MVSLFPWGIYWTLVYETLDAQEYEETLITGTSLHLQGVDRRGKSSYADSYSGGHRSLVHLII